MLSEKTFTSSQIVSVTAAATVLVMAVSTDSGVSRGGMKKITKKSNSRKSKYIRLYEYSKDIKMVTR